MGGVLNTAAEYFACHFLVGKIQLFTVDCGIKETIHI